MYFPQFLVGMLATTIGISIWVYLESGSIWASLGWAVLTLVVLQVGYVCLVIRLISRRSEKTSEAGRLLTPQAPSYFGLSEKVEAECPIGVPSEPDSLPKGANQR